MWEGAEFRHWDRAETKGATQANPPEANLPESSAKAVEEARQLHNEAQKLREQARTGDAIKLLQQALGIGIVFGVERSRDKRATGERKLRARRERRRLGRLIAPILGRTLVQPMMPAQPFHDPVTHPLGQLADFAS